MPEIKIVGDSKSYDLDRVSENVIKLGGNYYWKDDEVNLVKVPRYERGRQVGYRLFRKKSALLVKADGYYEMRSNCVEVAPNLWKLKHNTISYNGKHYEKAQCIELNGKYYPKSSSEVARDPLSNNGDYVVKKYATKLSEKYYDKETYTTHPTVNVGGEVVAEVHTITALTRKNEVEIDISIKNTNRSTPRSRVKAFHKWGSIKNCDPNKAYLLPVKFGDEAFFVSSSILGFFVHRGIVKDVEKQYKDWVAVYLAEKINHTRDTFNKRFSDAGPDENTAKVLDFNYKTWPGKYSLYQVAYGRKQNQSPTTSLTGGIGYSFGIEIETSAGVLSNQLCEELKIDKMGDRSIGSAEYVTIPLQGDNGVNQLKRIYNAIGEQTLVDDRCSTHIHVGGLTKETGPSFGSTFCINAIKLGTMIEKELFEMCPPNRFPSYKHCHSIMRYRDINSKNWKKYLGAYVFGPDESFKTPFVMDDYAIGTDGRSASSTVGTWSHGKYKWLNMIHAYTRSRGFNTIENRIFPATTNFEKAYNYLLITLAFTWFADNKLRRIDEGGVSLSEVISEAYRKHPKLRESVLEFIGKRKKKFKRNIKEEYPTKYQ